MFCSFRLLFCLDHFNEVKGAQKPLEKAVNYELTLFNVTAHLQDLIPCQQPSVPCDHPVSVHFLNHNVNERRFVSTHDADAQLNIRVRPVDLYGSYLSFRKGRQLNAA